MAIVGVPFGDRYVLSTYAISWFAKQYELIDWNSCNFVQGACEPKEYIVTWQDSALVFGVGHRAGAGRGDVARCAGGTSPDPP